MNIGTDILPILEIIVGMNELVERGVSYPTLRIEALPHVLLTVGGGGLRIKENARVPTLLP